MLRVIKEGNGASLTANELPYEKDLIEQALTTPISIEQVSGDESLEHLRLTCKIPEDDVETSAFGLIYTLSLLCFRDARPAGYSEKLFSKEDAWWAMDMLRCLSFNFGELHFQADYVRGRRMKTTITLKQDGLLTIDTSGRGQAPTRWISTIQGKKVMTVIQGEKA